MSTELFSRGIDGVQSLCVEICAIVHAQFHVAASVYGARQRLHLYDDFALHYDDTVRAKCIELAVNFRILDEHLSGAKAWRHLRRNVDQEDRAGFFIQPTTEPLSLRECCNKIVHAKGFKFQRLSYRTQEPSTGKLYVNECNDSEVVLHGDRFGVPWECRIDLLKFAERVHQALSRWLRGEFERMEND